MWKLLYKVIELKMVGGKRLTQMFFIDKIGSEKLLWKVGKVRVENHFDLDVISHPNWQILGHC